MIQKKRDIYIRVEKVREIVDLLEEIKNKEQNLRIMFEEYDKINSEENRTFENWNSYLEEVIQRLEHITL